MTIGALPQAHNPVKDEMRPWSTQAIRCTICCAMPTPFMHLALATDILDGDDLPAAARRLLAAHRGPFLLGNTAPDVQTVSGQERLETHFFTLPPTSDTPAQDALFEACPELAKAARLPSPQAAFIAGYIAHLTLDELWLRQIFLPFYRGSSLSWPERAFQHNLLRTWMDRQDLARINGSTATALEQAVPQGWLPFVDDNDLANWRDWLLEQLRPGRHIQTAEVFARRMGITADEMEAVLASPEQMAKRVLKRLPEGILEEFRVIGRARSIDAISRYLRNTNRSIEETNP